MLSDFDPFDNDTIQISGIFNEIAKVYQSNPKL
jgi:hypothetical protein